ncbi:hypothetical protein HKCCE4037_16185 [Rhodobacterales bacterium HKCCE4037]|nr:hypothetical protein [Rhodobacterales bacterium HKCCE4037]
MSEAHGIHFDEARESYIFPLEGYEASYRVVVSRDFLDDEVGESATRNEREVWIKNNLAQILGAATARLTGGTVTEPWSRVLVEELP